MAEAAIHHIRTLNGQQEADLLLTEHQRRRTVSALARHDARQFGIDAARDELKHAFRNFEIAHDGLKRAAEEYQRVEDLWAAWMDANPAPDYESRRWSVSADEYARNIKWNVVVEAHRDAVTTYRTAQEALALVKAANPHELALKAAGSLAFEPSALIEKPQPHLNGETQIVGWSVAWDMTLLARAHALF
jgi:hypothetical protein